MFFPVIEVSGTPYDIGFQHGQKARTYIESAIETYTEAFKTYANMDWGQAKIQSKNFIPFIEQYDQDLMDEPGLRVGTVFTILMDIERSEMLVAPGTPCNTQYEMYRF